MNHDEQAGSPDLQAGLNALACPEIGVKWFLFLFWQIEPGKSCR
jgi:hypothetical protein